MAKTKTRSAITETRELDKVIKIGDADYNVNAVQSTHSDAATKVDNTLTVKLFDKEGTDAANNVPTEVAFNGEEDKTITAVPAEGGTFQGKLWMNDEYSDTREISNLSLLNYGDIVKVIGQLTGAGWFTWDGTLTFQSVTKDNIPQRMGIVVGTEENLESFTTENFYKKYLPLYLYIGTGVDSDNRATGTMYLGNSESSNTTKLASTSNKIVSNENTDISFTAEDIAKIKENCETDKVTLNGISNLMQDLEQYIEYTQKGYKIESLHNWSSVFLDWFILLMTGEYKGNDPTILEYGSEVKRAKKAICDTEDKPIHLNYYRSASNTQNINTITIQNYSPADSMGTNGDIWIVY